VGIFQTLFAVSLLTVSEAE